MFCKNCGAEITENEKFCGKCGTSVGKADQSAMSGVKLESPLANSEPINGPLAVAFIATAVLQLIVLIFRFVPFGKYYVAVKDLGIGDGGTYSINELMGSSGETAIFVIMILISIALCILPIIKNSLNKRRRMVLSKIAAFWNVLTIALGIWALSDCVTSNKESITHNFGEEFFTGSWGLTFGGWLNIIVTIATIVLLFAISKKTKQYTKK